jgi:hypothetical protein
MMASFVLRAMSAQPEFVEAHRPIVMRRQINAIPASVTRTLMPAYPNRESTELHVKTGSTARLTMSVPPAHVWPEEPANVPRRAVLVEPEYATRLPARVRAIRFPMAHRVTMDSSAPSRTPARPARVRAEAKGRVQHKTMRVTRASATKPIAFARPPQDPTEQRAMTDSSVRFRTPVRRGLVWVTCETASPSQMLATMGRVPRRKAPAFQSPDLTGRRATTDSSAPSTMSVFRGNVTRSRAIAQ